MLTLLAKAFDKLEAILNGSSARKFVALSIVSVFLVTIFVVELKRQGLLPDDVATRIPSENHFAAVDLALGLLLIFEVIGLVFGLGKSVSNTVGKQIEIFSLILLRKALKEFSHFSEPLEWNPMVSHTFGHMLSDAFGALAIFCLLGVYYRIQRHDGFAKRDSEQGNFIASKKVIALCVLTGCAIVGLTDLAAWVEQAEDRLIPFFEVTYTLLIFADILLVLISLQYHSTFQMTFRNSGFAVATVFLRIALVAPPYFNAAIGVAVAVYAVFLTMAYNFFNGLSIDLAVDRDEGDLSVVSNARHVGGNKEHAAHK